MLFSNSVCGRCSLRFARWKSTIPALRTEQEIISKHLKRIKKNIWKVPKDANSLEQLNKNYADGRAHVTSTNYKTDQKSVVRLSLPAVRRRYYIVRQSDLPEEAKEGLRSALVVCNRNPKMLQHEADLMTDYLALRRFPATPQEIRAARRVVKDEIMETDFQVQNELRNPRSAAFLNKLIYKKAQEKLAGERYNWKPLEFTSKEDAAVYALSTFGGYYAEMRRVLAEFHRNRFVPDSILDFGSGVGAAFWASHELWGDQIKHYCLVDRNFHMRNFSMDIMRGKNYTGSGEFVNKHIYFRKGLLPSANTKYDLVIVHRTLIEMPSHEERMELIKLLWERTNNYLVIVESPMYDSFKSLMKIREFIVSSGYKFDYNYVKNELDKKDLLNLELANFLANKQTSDYEKFCKVQDLLGEDFVIPTKMEPGYVFAPCPHDQYCPKYSVEACKFKVRWTESRADFKTRSLNKDGTDTGKFSYVIFEKGKRPEGKTVSRILAKSNYNKCVTCTVCTQNDGIQTYHVSHRTKDLYKRMKNAEASQFLPLDDQVVRSGPRMPVQSARLSSVTQPAQLSIDIGESYASDGVFEETIELCESGSALEEN